MKQLLLLLALTVAFITKGHAQCLTHVKYYASQMEMLDSSFNHQGTKDEPFTIETRPDGFTGIRENEVEDSLHGVLKNVTCNWGEPFKNGKITMVCDVTSKDEDVGEATITIEAIEGKINITLRAKERPERILRLVVDKYEELK